MASHNKLASSSLVLAQSACAVHPFCLFGKLGSDSGLTAKSQLRSPAEGDGDVSCEGHRHFCRNVTTRPHGGGHNDVGLADSVFIRSDIPHSGFYKYHYYSSDPFLLALGYFLSQRRWRSDFFVKQISASLGRDFLCVIHRGTVHGELIRGG